MPLSAALLALAFFAHAAPAKKLESSGPTKLVELFLKTPTGQLPPERVPEFLAVDPNVLPAKLRDGYKAKRMELLALKSIADGKYKPPVRMLGKEGLGTCDPPDEMTTVVPLLQTGFEELTEDEENRLLEDTGCTECELRTEFSMKLVVTPPVKKGGKKRLHYLLMAADPLMAYVGAIRQGRSARTSSFFGIGGSVKCR